METDEASGIPIVEWTWYHNEKPILGVTNTFFVNSTESNISILTAKTAQPGNFSCEAKNLVGSDLSPQTEVILVEVPRLPTIQCDKASELPNRAVCRGDFESIQRERLPTGFHVELTILDGALLTYNSIVDLPYTGDQITVRPLNSSTDYRARFKAFNEAGESEWSEPEVFSTGSPTEPEPTTNISWQCDETKCTFNWEQSDDNGMPITGYNVQVSQPNNTQEEGFETPVFDETILENTVSIYSLTPNSFYEFRVRAINKIGSSEYALSDFQIGDQPGKSALLTIILVCLLILIIFVIVIVFFMTKCRKQIGGKSAGLNDPSSVEEGQNLVPQTAETRLT